ncbi:4328_t:CDS:2, partial [Gigaspora margarita]
GQVLPYVKVYYKFTVSQVLYKPSFIVVHFLLWIKLYTFKILQLGYTKFSFGSELQVTTSTSLLKYKGLGNCRALANELFQKQVISLYKRFNSTGTEALATKLKLNQGFNDARIVNVMSDLEKIDNLKKIWKFNLACLVLLKAEELKFHFNFSSELWQIEQGGTLLNEVLEKVFNQKTADVLKRLNLFTTAQLTTLENCLIDDRRNRKLVSEYVTPGYNLLALSIELLADKAKILGEHYCNIPLADPNQFEIKKYKGCSGNTAKITGKVDEE